MASKRYILLEVDDHRADELMTALGKRDYIKRVSFDTIEQRRAFKECPICQEELEKEWKVTVTEKILESCLAILQGMKTSRTMVVYSYSLIEEVRPIDYERSVAVQTKILLAARLLGIVGHYLDGTQDTFYVTEVGLKFLAGKKPISPSELIVIKGKTMRSSGSMEIGEVRHKEPLKFNNLLLALEKAVKGLPDDVVEFSRTGQASLL